MAKPNASRNSKSNNDSVMDDAEAAEMGAAPEGSAEDAEAAAPPARAVKGAKAPAPEPRTYKGTLEVDHDLFRLRVAQMVKNTSYTDTPDYEKFEHCHIFHSVDSNGRKLTECSPVGQHFHRVEVIDNGEGMKPSLKISPPLKWEVRRVNGKLKKMAVPLTDSEGDVYDNHTHEAEYIRSERIKIRHGNVEAAKLEAAVRGKFDPSMPDGVKAG